METVLHVLKVMFAFNCHVDLFVPMETQLCRQFPQLLGTCFWSVVIHCHQVLDSSETRSKHSSLHRPTDTS